LGKAAGSDEQRELQQVPSTDFSTIRCFYECVNQGMTSEECVQYIKEVLGENLDGHEIPNLQIKISPPRTPKSISETYWMIGIPTNIYGEVDCDIHNGDIVYPWDWEIAEGNFVTIPPVSCIGLNANACCDKVLKEVSEAGIPLVDKNGNCLSCWVHQEPLEPVISAGTNSLAYLEHASPDGVTCAVSELDPPTVQSVDDGVETQVVKVREGIDKILNQNPVNCGDFIQLHRDLLLYGRAFPAAMSKISGLLCGICDNPSDIYVLTPEMMWTLNWIKVKLTGEINSDENCIIIYTDHQDLVMEPPKIGGSRGILDWDRDDPDCENPPTSVDNPAMAPVMPPNPAGGSCPLPKVEVPAGSGNCICPMPYTDDSFGGCNACANRSADLSNGCMPNPSPCPDNMVESVDGCVCASGFIDVNGVCEPNESNDCISPKIADASGTCVCPANSIDIGGVCKVECTIEDVIEQYGTNGPCGSPYTNCLEKECGEHWSADCLELLGGTSSMQSSASAWAQCLQNDSMSGPAGSLPGSDGASAKSKAKSQAGAKSVGSSSVASAKAGSSKTSSKTTTKASAKATGGNSKRRAVRRLGKTTDTKTEDTKASDSKTNDSTTKDTKSTNSKTNDSTTKDTKASDSKTSDTTTKDTKASDSKTSDTESKDTKTTITKSSSTSGAPVTTSTTATASSAKITAKSATASKTASDISTTASSAKITAKSATASKTASDISTTASSAKITAKSAPASKTASATTSVVGKSAKDSTKSISAAKSNTGGLPSPPTPTSPESTDPPSQCALKCSDVGLKPLEPSGPGPVGPPDGSSSVGSAKSAGGSSAKSASGSSAKSAGGSSAKSASGSSAKSAGGSSAKSAGGSSAKSAGGSSAKSAGGSSAKIAGASSAKINKDSSTKVAGGTNTKSQGGSRT
jgi:hypothetical protein